jgi:uncharacterized protein YcbX
MAFIYLDRITIYPIKSFDGVDVSEAQVLRNGALQHDRRFALFDADGRFVNGKRTAAVQRIRAEYDLQNMIVRFNDVAEFSLLHEQKELSRWLSEALGIACELMESTEGGFPDDVEAPGPTVIGSGTIAEVTSWFPNLTPDETRRRFRANLEIAPVRAFWEDHYVEASEEDNGYCIDIDGNQWLGVKICQRCVVPSRAATTGMETQLFQKIFAQKREQMLPRWSPRRRFDHFYRLAINTRLVPGTSPGRIGAGSPVRLQIAETLL